MRINLIIILISFLILTSCQKGEPENQLIIKGFFDSMHFVRQGGGQIDFTLYPNENFDQSTVIVRKYDFRDTTAQYNILIDEHTSESFALLKQAMNNQIQINGAFQQSSLYTGTWVHIYLTNDSEEYEVTNTVLRESLNKFEQIIKDKIYQ